MPPSPRRPPRPVWMARSRWIVSIKGVTGSAAPDMEEVERRLAVIRSLTDLPVGVGFGIRDGATAARAARIADAVIVGSALVNRIAELADRPAEIPEGVAALLREMREAMDEV